MKSSNRVTDHYGQDIQIGDIVSGPGPKGYYTINESKVLKVLWAKEPYLHTLELEALHTGEIFYAPARSYIVTISVDPTQFKKVLPI